MLTYFGGRPGIINQASIESAIARPYSGYYRSMARKAAALTQSLVLNHGFVDGNKRTALLMLAILLGRSGYTLEFSSEDEANREAEEMALDVVARRLNFDELVEWFQTRLRRM